ncbi:ABC transporter substrate-binding protein [Amycolatopsis sp.]|uniref:ABC transporter substrate-binding protein n=1 Tax=Amycolatopsis sp. TaxID=37632 RepID=UPI002D046F01|nr:ABC transporter substrate-binding protein [Amycolatopsis sp.]HVV08352.1 ABC transporter substrate-binding protein [Amycolatopsis sp.]
MRRLAALLAGLVLLTGCATSGASGGTTIVLGDQQGTLQTLANASHAFDGTGYTVKWAEFRSGATLFQAMGAGQVDAAWAADLTTLQALSGGLRAKFVGAIQGDGSSSSLMVRGNSPIRTVADLKGKDVVVSSARGGIAEYLLAKVLQDNGLSYNDVHVRYLAFADAQAAFASGQIDAWATNGIYAETAKSQGGRVLADGRDGRTSGLMLVSALPASLDDQTKKTALGDVLTRLGAAYHWAGAHQAEYTAFYAAANKIPEATASVVVSQGQGTVGPVTPAVTSTVQSVDDLMTAIGVLPKPVTVAPLVDAAVYPAQ